MKKTNFFTPGLSPYDCGEACMSSPRAMLGGLLLVGPSVID